MNNLCPCTRQASGFAYDPRLAGVSQGPPVAACCMAHLKIITQKKGQIMPLTDTENLAVMNAAPLAGEYLDALGKTDLALMSYEEWCDFIAAVFDSCLAERGKLFETQSCGVPV